MRSFDYVFTNKYIDIEHLDIYNQNRDVIINSSLGTGKTYTTFKSILDNDFKILIICQVINKCR